MTDLQKKFLAAVEAHDLLRSGANVIAAVSGGADSMALLFALVDLSEQLNFRMIAAHLNHGIRGAAARADAEFVRAAARRLGIACVMGKANAPNLALKTGQSMEMAARQARYDFLIGAAKSYGCNTIATAHTADDQAETVLLRLLRGSGARGLAGIRYASMREQIRIIRPLLDVTRAEIEVYLKELGEKWREDKTNKDLSIQRNLVRLKILPMLEQDINPNVRATLRRAAGIIQAENDWLEILTRAHLKRCLVISKKFRGLKKIALQKLPVAASRRVILAWLRMLHLPEETLDYEVVENVRLLASAHSPKSAISMHGNARISHEAGLIVFKPAACPDKTPACLQAVLSVPGIARLNKGKISISARLARGIAREKPNSPGKLPARASLDAAGVGNDPLIIRSWRPGDRMRPFGMRGSRKLQDIFTDARIPVKKRAAIPLVLCRGSIIWIPGYRIAEGWQVPDASQPAVQLLMRKTR